jgi:hypothetical protein
MCLDFHGKPSFLFGNVQVHAYKLAMLALTFMEVGDYNRFTLMPCI